MPAYEVRGKVLFSQVSVCSHLGGGYPIPGPSGGGVNPSSQQGGGGGTSSQIQAGWYHIKPTGEWYPIPGPGRGTPYQVQVGSHPSPGIDGGYPIQLMGGGQRVPHPRSRHGEYPIPGPGSGVPHPRSGGRYSVQLVGGGGGEGRCQLVVQVVKCFYLNRWHLK